MKVDLGLRGSREETVDSGSEERSIDCSRGR